MTAPIEAPPRLGVSQLVRWCRVALTWQPEEDVTCLWEDCLGLSKGEHRLRIRRGLVCTVCDQVYWKKQAFDEHDCYSAF